MAEICVLTTVHNPLNTRVYYKEARAAVEAGHDVSMIAHDVPTDESYSVEFYSLGTAKTRLHRWLHIPRTYVIARKINADIYHFHDPELLPVGVLLAQRTDSGVIYDAHEDYGQNAIEYREWIPSQLRPTVKKTFPYIQSGLANRLDTVITTTASIADQFRRFGHSHVEVIHNYPRTEDISISDVPFEKQAEVTLVYVGSFEHIHGLIPMLRLISELVDRDTDIELVMIGEFDNAERERRANEFLEDHGIRDHVRFVGYVPYEQIFSYLHLGDIGVCLVDKKRCEYALPTKIFEYMYSRTPVLATDAEAIRPYVTSKVGRLVSQTDPPEQADAVLELHSNPDELDQMGKRGRELVKQKYNWENEARRLNTIYDALL
jgi:glycosyltransferase involved in cell wall biosynthesis